MKNLLLTFLLTNPSTGVTTQLLPAIIFGGVALITAILSFASRKKQK